MVVWGTVNPKKMCSNFDFRVGPIIRVRLAVKQIQKTSEQEALIQNLSYGMTSDSATYQKVAGIT